MKEFSLPGLSYNQRDGENVTIKILKSQQQQQQQRTAQGKLKLSPWE